MVAFAPRNAGTHYGAVVLTNKRGNPIGIGYLQGTGLGPQTTFLPGTESEVGSSFDSPFGVAVDGKGDVYVTDDGGNLSPAPAVYKETFSEGRYVRTVVGAGWNEPRCIAVDGAGNIFVCDEGTDSTPPEVYKETPANGSYTRTPIGVGFQFLTGVAVDTRGNVYVADGGTGVLGAAIYKEALTNGGYSQTTVASNFVGPTGVAVDDNDNVYVVDGNGAIYKETLETNGRYTRSRIGTERAATGIAVDGNGNIYVAAGTNVVKEALRPNGTYSRTVIVGGYSNAYSAALTGNGNLYVVDSYGAVFKEDVAGPPMLGFDRTVRGATSADSPEKVMVSNFGNAALKFSEVEFPTDFPESGRAANDCRSSTVLAAGNSCALTIDFKPVESLGGKTVIQLSERVTVTTDTLNTTATKQAVKLIGTDTATTASSRSR